MIPKIALIILTLIGILVVMSPYEVNKLAALVYFAGCVYGLWFFFLRPTRNK